MDIEIVYQVNTGWLVVHRDLFSKCISKQKKMGKAEKNETFPRIFCFSIVSFCFSRGYLLISSWEISDSTGKFILHPARSDRIAKGKEKKFTGENCFSIDTVSVLDLCGIFKYSLQLSPAPDTAM